MSLTINEFKVSHRRKICKVRVTNQTANENALFKFKVFGGSLAEPCVSSKAASRRHLRVSLDRG
jgi:hypothetical protein